MKCVPAAAFAAFRLSLPVRGAWVEILSEWQALDAAASLPVRGAWVEILLFLRSAGRARVAPRAGSVG